MFKLIVEKKLREIIGSAKFAFSFAICSALILLTFYIGARNYQVSVSRYEAAKAENLRQMEGLTDWVRVNNHRVFLPPQPLEVLVSGISNDIGRTIEVQGRGELTANDSRFNDDPIFAVFRFLDLDFIFQIVLSLFAILFAYDAINGEKERGTLRLSFANAIPKDKFILGKLVGSFTALSVPLLIPILLGSLLFPLLDVHLSGQEWLRFACVILAGLLYFGVFFTLSVFVSSVTRRSSTSFLMLLVIWIFSVLIIPRTSVLLAARSVDVPSVDELATQKRRLRSQLWNEDRKKMADFRPTSTEGTEKVMDEFNEFMQGLSDERNERLEELANRLNEQRRNKQMEQARLAFSLSRVSPSAAFSLAATNLASTSISLKEQFLGEALGYQKTYAEFMKEKTGMNLGGGFVMIRTRTGGPEQEEPKAIDPNELPPFVYSNKPASDVIKTSLFDMGILAIFNLIFFSGAFVAFLRYDVR
ncbi:ABC transporter permease [bacterium]|nr:ABC transporter permease [bacterium]